MYNGDVLPCIGCVLSDMVVIKGLERPTDRAQQDSVNITSSKTVQ